MAILMEGCAAKTHRRIDGGPNILARLAPGDNVTAILQEPGEKFSAGKEGKFTRCIVKALRNARPSVRLLPPEEFRRTVFPGVSPEGVALTAWESVAQEAPFQERIGSLGLRYLMLLQARTRVTDWRHVSYRVGGEMWTEYLSSVKATIFDLEARATAATYQVEISGTSRIFFLIVLPVPLRVAYTESEACREIGRVVSEYFSSAGLADQP